MTTVVLDTTVIIHLFRRNAAALEWFDTQDTLFSITPITWMEVLVGSSNKRAQIELEEMLSGFEMIYLTSSDMDWAMEQMSVFHFSKGVGVMDCFNASVCQRLEVPVYTHNLKDYLKILPKNLVVQPYK